ncbi:hypothetical protein LXL04_000461 [Taraxacum kok-saghyz]
MWYLRLLKAARFNPKEAYDGHPTLCTIKLYHGGEFTKFPNVRYVEGKVNYVDNVDIEEFSIFQLDVIMKGLCYKGTQVMYYHFLVPGGDFHFGLRPLGNDDDFYNFAQYVREHKIMRVFIEHGNTNLLTYFMNPKPVRKVTIVRLDEIQEEGEANAEVTPPNHTVNEANKLALPVSISPEFNRKTIMREDAGMSSCSRRLSMDDVVEREQRAKDFIDAASDFDLELYQQILQNNMDNVVERVEPNVNEGNGMDGEEENNVEKESQVYDYNDGYVQDASADESDDVMEDNMAAKGAEPVENEGAEPVENEGANSVEEGSETNVDEGSETDDSEYWVDEENIIDDVEVDMREFHLNIDTEAEFLEARARKSTDQVSDAEPGELDVIDNDAFDSVEEDSDQGRKRRAILKQIGKEKTCFLGEVHTWKFHIGQQYNSKDELKEKIRLHSLETRKNLHFVKNDKKRLRAICKGKVAFTEPEVDAPSNDSTTGIVKSKGKKQSKKQSKGNKKTKADSCPWILHASRSTEESSWYIKTYEQVHTCLNSRKIKAATAKFLSNQFVDQLESNPKVPVKALQEQLMKKYKVGFSKHKIFRAKAKAKKYVVGDCSKQYELLRDYALELQSTNPDTTVKLEMVTEGNISSMSRQFKRIYVCLGGMKKGFRACLRDFLGLDGTHLKGAYTGQILTAVGVDSNNGIYPLAYAIVEIENFQSWTWFLTCLGDDLELDSMSNFTFMSDRQKGLKNAIEQLFPCAEHRYCLRHIHKNMRRWWPTKEYKDHLWKCATASTVPEFNHLMNELSIYDKSAYEYLKKISPQHWARSHFSGRATTDMLLNNICEVFNGKLVDGRDKPIITCLEFIREYMVKRICNVIKVQQKAPGPLTPATQKIMEKNEAAATDYHVLWNGDDKYQVQGPWQDQQVVDMGQRDCSCRKWELTGFPCKHVIAVLHNKADNGEPVGQLHTYVHKVHWLQTWKDAYVSNVEPIKGRAMWPVSDCPFKITPPPYHTQPGRPKRKRRQSMDERVVSQNESQNASQNASQRQSEGQGSQAGPSHSSQSGPTGKLTRKFIKVSCRTCGKKGHNKRTCPDKGGN